MTAPATASAVHDPYAALRVRDFRLFISGRLLAAMAVIMQDVAVGWQLYERTHSPLALGLTGLASVLPTLLVFLPAGTLADRHDRRNVVRIGRAVAGAMSVVLAYLSYTQGPVWMMYAALFVGGIGYAFVAPAQAAFLSQVVPTELFANAVTWGSTAFQIAAVTGPAIAGGLIALTRSATAVYVTCAVMAAVYLTLVTMLRLRPQERSTEPVTRNTLAAGLHFVFADKIVLAAITLDLFAVLLGGATALLPIYAKDILRVGPTGLGWLRAAPSIGAIATAVWWAHRRPTQRTGIVLLIVVAGFGVSTIIFGLSRSFGLSMIALGATGAFDSVSMVIRSSLVQLRTPDVMRGRVNAVNGIFVDLSNELGAFESGAVAQLVGATATVVGGGIGTILVVTCVAVMARTLRNMQTLDAALE